MRINMLFALVILASFIYGTQYYFKQVQATPFQASIIQLAPQHIRSITIKHQKEDLLLIKEPIGWIATNDSLSIKALHPPVQTLLQHLSSIEIDTIVAEQAEDWHRYNLTNEQALHISIQNDQAPQEQFLLGFSDSLNAYPFIRLKDELEVYQIKGQSIPVLPTSFHHFRSTTFSNIPESAKIDSITFKKQDSVIHQLQFRAGEWLDALEQPIDSLKTNRFLQNLTNLTCTEFADDFDEVATRKLPKETLILYLDAASDSLFFHCYRDTVDQQRLILKSPYNEAYFSSDSMGLYKDLFLDLFDIFTP